MAVLNRALERSQPKTATPLRLGPVLLLAGAAVLLIGLLQVVQTSDATTTSFAIQRLGQERLELQTRVHQLEAEVAYLSSLSRVEQEAEGRLGLVPPQAQETVPVNVDWPSADQPRLPTRFAPEEETEVDGQGSTWWRDLLELLPFF